MARTSVATADGTSVANFTQLNSDWGSIQVGSGVFTASASNNNNEAAAVWSGSGTFTNDHYGEITIGALQFASIDYATGVITRASTDLNGARDFMFAFVAGDSGGPTYTTVLGKVVNGTRTALHSAAVTWVDGDKISLESEGTTHRVCKNGTAIGGSFTQTDASLSTGKPGICANGALVTGDNWEGGSLSSGTTLAVSGSALTSGIGSQGNDHSISL